MLINTKLLEIIRGGKTKKLCGRSQSEVTHQILAIMHTSVQQVKNNPPLLLLRIIICQVNDHLDLGLIGLVGEQELRDHVQLALDAHMLHVLEWHIELDEPIQRVVAHRRRILVA